MNRPGGEWNEYVLETPHLRLAARGAGPADGVPLLALHGWLDNAASFHALAPYLAGVRLVALDLPGHGHSQHLPPGVHYHFVDYPAAVLAAADALEWERFALLGHSMGAGVAGFTAALAPERVSALTLIDGLGPLSGLPEEEPQRLRQAMAQMRAQPGARSKVYRDVEAAARVRARVGRLPLATARELAQWGTRSVDGGVAWRYDLRLNFRSPSYLTEEQVLAFLREVRCPTQVFWAQQGLLASRPTSEGRLAALAPRHVEPLHGGHHLHAESPQEVAVRLVAFLGAAPTNL